MLRWLVGGLLLAAVQSVSAQRYIFASVPNIIRAGNSETVAVNVIGARAGGAVAVSVGLKLVDGRIISPTQDVMVDSENPQIVQLYVDPDVIEADPERAQQAKVKVSCGELGFQEEKDVLISFEEGYVFIQTDKPIYTRGQRVMIRLFILDQHLRSSDQECLEDNVEVSYRLFDRSKINKPSHGQLSHGFLSLCTGLRPSEGCTKVELNILTPQGVIVYRRSGIRVSRGLKSHAFHLPPEPVFGNWTVVASHGAGLKYNRSVNFEVREYVLPTFSVVLRTPEYILERTEQLDFDIQARYVHGKPVLGRYYAKLGIVELDGEITIREEFAGRIEYNGRASFRLSTELLGDNWFEDNVHKRLYTEVSVLETASGISENTSDTSTMFVHSPYIFNVGRTVKYFKKGLMFQLEVDLRLVNGKPAKLVDIEVNVFENLWEDAFRTVEKRTDDRGRWFMNIRAPANANAIHVQLDTKDVSLVHGGVDKNARYEFDMLPHISPAAGKLLKIIPVGEPHVGGDLLINVDVVSAGPVDELVYYVVNKGQIEQIGRETDVENGEQFAIHVTYSMVPSFRVVAFSMSGRDVIADALWIEVPTPACENRVGFTEAGPLGSAIRQNSPISPSRIIEIKVTGEPFTTVALLGVNKAVYLLEDFHRLNPAKMFRTMDSHDTGCGPGGGQTSADTFKNAGVTVLTNAVLEVEPREGFGCDTPLNARRRRSVEGELEADLGRFGGDEEETYACRRGHRLKSLRPNCEQRASRFADRLSARYPGAGAEKIRRLLRILTECCERAQSLRNGQSRPRTGFPLYFPSPGYVRTELLETWIFDDIQIISESGEARLAYTAPDSITEWHITAVALSDTLPMCIAELLDVLTRKDLFIQLHMPYSVIREEQVEIMATIFNYGQEDIQVDVAISTPEEVCTQGTPGSLSANRTARVGGNDATSVRYVLIGLEEGYYPITVAAMGRVIGAENVYLEDAVEKGLWIEARVTNTSISPNEEDGSWCPFKIDTNIPVDPHAWIVDRGIHEDPGEVVRRVFAKIGYRSNDKTNVGVVDFGLPSGYAPIMEDIAEISNTSECVGRYEISQRSVVFYVDHIPSVDALPTLTLEFRIQRVYPVGNLQPVPIVVYDYYNPTLTCTKFYTLGDDEENRLAIICEGDECVCAAGNCLQCGPLDPDDLKDRSCADSRIYVYKIYIQERKRGVVGFDVLIANVVLVLKRADDREITASDNTREFWISTSCRNYCEHWPKGGQSFLVMGMTTLEYMTEDNQRSFKYILDHSSTLTFWPPNRRRKTREQFYMLEHLRNDFLFGNNGCQ